ncbi:MAG: hypothetical protein AB7S26_31995 [Sandaracinaceae bacterium]
MRVPSVLALVLACGCGACGCGAKTGLRVPPCSDEAGLCCTPSEEICNDEDDDCDGVIDDGIACFTLDGSPIDAQITERCGVAWYAYDDPDGESANPTPDIRLSGEVVVAFQYGPSCDGASLAVIADLPMDGSGGELGASFAIDPVSAAGILVSDEPRECTLDPGLGEGACTWVWQPCCTDGVLLGPFDEDACVTLTLAAPVGVAHAFVLDGAGDRVERAFGTPMELCARIRPAAP